MSINSIVLEQGLGANSEGDVIHCDEELAQSLIAAGIAREATPEDLVEEEPAEEVTEGEDTPDMVQDQVARVARSAEAAVTKATEKAVEKLAGQVKRPSFVPQNRHIAGSDLNRTGGFKNLGDAAQCFIKKSKGDYEAARKWSRWGDHVTKTAMTIGGGSGHQGGDLVPTEWSEELWKLSFSDVPDLLTKMKRYEMRNQTEKIVAWTQTSATSGVTAATITEGSSITASVGTTATVSLTLTKLAVLVNVTDELMRFNSYNLQNTIEQVVPERLAYYVNDNVVNGTSGNHINLVSNAAAVQVPRATVNRINYNDISLMYQAAFYKNGAVWLANPSSFSELVSLSFPNRSATTQVPVMLAGGMAGDITKAPTLTLFGLPVYFVENVPALGSAGDLILWHPGSCAAGYSQVIGDETKALYFDLAQDTFRFLFYSTSVNPQTAAYQRRDSSYASNVVILKAITS